MTIAGLTVAVAAGLAGCGSTHRSAVGSSQGWGQWGGNAQNTHYATSRQLTPANVRRLSVVWRRAEGPEQFGWETFPVVVGDTMYYTTNTDQVVAVSATTGRLRWSYTPQVDFLADPAAIAVQPVNRGVTVAHGRLFEVTWDDQLIALDARSGAPLWDDRVGNPVTGAAQDSPGAYWDGEIIIGGPAGDTGSRGFVAAYNATTGDRLWRTYVVPARNRSWMARSNANGGGDVWMAPVVNPQTGTVYAATGNPTPAFSTGTRTGCDRWTDATVAIDARTGHLRWGHSAMCGDAWDYDSDQSPIQLNLHQGQRVLPVIADASKAGFVYVVNARTGSLVARSPSLVRFSEPHRQPTAAGVVVCPGIFGGIEYGPSAYSRQTGLLYVAATDACMRYRAGPVGVASRGTDGGDGLNGTVTPLAGQSGVVTAVNPGTGRVSWRARLAEPARGGVLATAGGLVLAGDDDGYLYAFSARSGRTLWRFRTGLRFGSAPLAYEIAGREYIAVAAGGSSATETGEGVARGGGELYVFALRR